MNNLARITALLLISCTAQAAPSPAPEAYIDVQHDTRRQVTCWIVNGTGISCLPDSMIKLEPATKTSAPAKDKEEVFQL